MAAALQDVKGGMSMWEAARLYNLSCETLRRTAVKLWRPHHQLFWLSKKRNN